MSSTLSSARSSSATHSKPSSGLPKALAIFGQAQTLAGNAGINIAEVWGDAAGDSQQQRTAWRQLGALVVDEGLFDTCPWLNQSGSRDRAGIVDLQQVVGAIGRNRGALVEQDVLLQAAFEVVAEGTVRTGSLEFTPVGLNQVTATS